MGQITPSVTEPENEKAYEAAMAAKGKKDWPRVMVILSPAMEAEGTGWPQGALVDLAHAALQLGQYAKAAAAFVLVRQSQSENLAGWSGGAFAASRLGNWQEAVELWHGCLARAGEARQQAWWLAALGDALIKLEHWHDAAEIFASMRERWPDDPSGWRGGAIIAGKLERFATAAGLWADCIARTPIDKQPAWWRSSLADALKRAQWAEAKAFARTESRSNQGPSGEDEPDAPSRHVFIVTYGRSGSTLLQNLLNMLPGTCIRGENMLASLHLARAWAGVALSATLKNVRKRDLALGPSDPWFGIENIDPNALGLELAEFLRQHFLIPPSGTVISGFKEIRWHQAGDFFNTHLDFLRQFFPGTRFIFNTRQHESVARSAWWSEMGIEEVEQTLNDAEQMYKTYAAMHPGICAQVHYDTYVNDIEGFRPIFDLLGLPFDPDICNAAIAQKLKHLQTQS